MSSRTRLSDPVSLFLTNASRKQRVMLYIASHLSFVSSDLLEKPGMVPPAIPKLVN